MKASAYIAAFLADQGVTTVFELTGGMITHLLDSLYERGDIRIVSMHHEQAAAFAAEGGARMTGVPGVALATSGPGATNLITGIGSCYFDSVPTVFITGQVNTHELRADSGVRQAGFQETDIVEIAKPIAKAAWQVSSAAELPDALATAFRIALEGRPGPVLLDVPMDVQRQDVVASPAGVVAPKRLEPGDIGPVVAVLSAADRPLILAGGGVRTSGGAGLLRDFAQATRIPVVSTLMGLDVLPSGHALRVGLIGTYGNRWANLALGDADCILALGARLDIRQTGADVSAFAEGKRIIKVDVDERQLAWRIPADIAVQADLAAFLEAARAAATTVEWRDTSAWLDRIGEYEAQWPDAAELAGLSGINPADVVRELSEAIPERPGSWWSSSRRPRRSARPGCRSSRRR